MAVADTAAVMTVAKKATVMAVTTKTAVMAVADLTAGMTDWFDNSDGKADTTALMAMPRRGVISDGNS